MTFQDMLAVLIMRIKFIILIAVLGGVSAFCVSEFLITKKYQSSVQIYVKSTADTSATGDINATQISTAKSLAETYIIILNDNTVYERIADRFSDEYEPEKLNGRVPMIKNDKGELQISPSYIKSCVSIAAVNESEILQISAQTEYPQISADICNYMVDVAPDILRRVTKAGSVEEISAPKVPTAPSSPNVKKNTAAGVLAGIVLSIAFVLLHRYFNNRVIGASDIKERYGVSVLAEIPSFEIKTTKGAYK